MAQHEQRPTVDSASEARQLLTIYLQDHRAGAATGLAVVRRCRKAHLDPALDDVLAKLETDVAEDVDTLDRVMERLGVERSRVKDLGGTAGEWIGRAKLNGRVLRRSPLSDLLELEAIAAAIVAKRSLWRALGRAGVDDDAASLLDGLAERASDQLARVEGAHDAVAGRVLGAA